MGLINNYSGGKNCQTSLLLERAALNRTNINVQELAVQAVLTKDEDSLFQAIALDPLTSSILTLDEIRKMVDEMLEAGLDMELAETDCFEELLRLVKER